jgi:hypothetical protein
MLINGKIINDDLFLNLIGPAGEPIFLAVYEENSKQLNLHTTLSGKNNALKQKAEKLLLSQGVKCSCKIKSHKFSSLFKRKNIDQFLQSFGNGIIVYDPTASIGRARVLVDCARKLRCGLGNKFVGIYLEPWSRHLYVVLNIDKFKKNKTIEPELLAETETQIITAINQALHNTSKSFKLSVKVGFQLPNRKLAPIDLESSKFGKTNIALFQRFRSGSISTTFAALIGMGISSSASADGPAVSAPNAKISVSGGETDGSATILGDGSYAWPVGDNYGAQIDTIGGRISDDILWGVGGHFFWRDPEKGLLGVNLAHAQIEDINLTRVGSEGELYLGSVTAILDAGYQFGANLKKGFSGGLDLRWYPTDNFYVSAGGAVTAGDTTVGMGMEYMPVFSSLPGLSFFADGAVGENDFDQVLVGLRYYFGPKKKKSLIRRHREDDPKNIFTGISSVTQSMNIQRARNQRIRNANANAYGGT